MLNFPILKTRKIFSLTYFKKLNLFRILFVLFTFGFVFGAILIAFNKQETLNQLGFVIQNFITTRAKQSFFSVFFSSIYKFFPLVLIIFLAGFIPIAQPISFFIPIFHGLGLGICTSFLYSSRGFNGFLFCVLLIAPCEIIFSFIIILASKCSINLSNKMFKNIFYRRLREKNKLFLKEYLCLFLALLIFLFLAALVDTLTTLIFARFFV